MYFLVLRPSHFERNSHSLEKIATKNPTHHVEGTLGQVVVRAREDLLEALDGVLEGHEHPLGAGEHFGHGEGLGHETLYLTGPRHGELVVFRELVHSEDGNDVLEEGERAKTSKMTLKNKKVI